jgi:competence protein ComEA
VFALVHHDGSASTPLTADLPMAVGADTTSLTGDRAAPGVGNEAELIVQVAGAVRRPGVFHLPASSRVGDLVARAGGLTTDADVDRIDLAAPLADGALIYLPRRGQALPPGPVVGGGDSSTGGSSGAGGSSTSLMVDVNTATAEELDALPGVGPTTAAAIVAYRQQHGVFRSVDDLADVTGIGPAKLAQIRPHVHL